MGQLTANSSAAFHAATFMRAKQLHHLTPFESVWRLIAEGLLSRRRVPSGKWEERDRARDVRIRSRRDFPMSYIATTRWRKYWERSPRQRCAGQHARTYVRGAMHWAGVCEIITCTQTAPSKEAFEFRSTATHGTALGAVTS